MKDCCTPAKDCPCCEAGPCPYCVLLSLIDQLKHKGVCPDVAAQIAASFVSDRCCSTPSDLNIAVKPIAPPVPMH